jgi:hypothetical protein
MERWFNKANLMNWVFVAVGILLLFSMGSVDSASSGDMSMNFFASIGGAALIAWGGWNIVKS